MYSELEYTPTPSVEPFLVSNKPKNFIVGPVGCVRGDTIVLTEVGPTPISRIDRPMRVLSWNATTCRFQLSWCGGAFPKGMDYLYQVSTPAGGFAAAAQHRMLTASGEYRPVAELLVGDAVETYSPGLHPTIEELSQSVSPLDAPHCSRTRVDYLDDCAASARLYGRHILSLADTCPVFAPIPADVPLSASRFSHYVSGPLGGPAVPLRVRILRAIYDAHSRIDDWLDQPAHPPPAGGALNAGEFCGRAVGQALTSVLSRWMRSFHRQARKHGARILRFLRYGALSFSSSGYNTTSRPIISVSRGAEKEVFWDLQVDGTHNYVSVDGAIHHNSTKTTAGIIKIGYEAARVAPCRDGIRRSRCVVVRNTRQMLWDTTIPDFLKWFPDGEAGILERTNSRFILKLDGVECEVLFRGLDDANDVRRLLSLQLSFGVMDEFREINPDVYNMLTTRLGRYPDGIMVPHRPEWGVDAKGNPIQGCVDDSGAPVEKVWGMTNPPDRDTFWEELLSNPTDDCAVVIQPSGTAPEADWVKHLPQNYYENMMVGKTEDWISVYVHGEWGKSLSGSPVFKCFDRDTHVAKEKIIVQQAPLVIGVDAGLNPTAVISQQMYDGRVLVLGAITGNDAGMGALRFIRERLKPLLAQRFPGCTVAIVIDPAAFQRAQTDERTVADIYKAEGFTVRPARTNALAARIAVVESYLTRTVNGKAAMLIDPECVELIQALAGKYRYKINAKGVQEDTPEKSHPWSDYGDGLQYACLQHDGGTLFGANVASARREIKPAPTHWARC